MRTLLLGAAATIALFGAAAGGAQAAPAQLISGVYQASDAPGLVQAQFLFGGQNYCWYAIGWRGPGYYWCGYAQRRGLGWGGGDGWNGWHGGGHGGSRGGHTGGRGAAAFGGSSHGGHTGGHGTARVGAGHASGGHAGGGHAGGGHAGGHPHG